MSQKCLILVVILLAMPVTAQSKTPQQASQFLGSIDQFFIATTREPIPDGSESWAIGVTEITDEEAGSFAGGMLEVGHFNYNARFKGECLYFKDPGFTVTLLIGNNAHKRRFAGYHGFIGFGLALTHVVNRENWDATLEHMPLHLKAGVGLNCYLLRLRRSSISLTLDATISVKPSYVKDAKAEEGTESFLIPKWYHGYLTVGARFYAF